MGSVTRVDIYGKDGRMKLNSMDMWSVYTAFAPMDDGRVLVKVGISVVPHNRVVQLYCNCPFPIVRAAFIQAGRKKKALAIERGILDTFVDKKTRGEWLVFPDDAQERKLFAERSRAIVEGQTGMPCKWTHISKAQISASIAAGFSRFEMGG